MLLSLINEAEVVLFRFRGGITLGVMILGLTIQRSVMMLLLDHLVALLLLVLVDFQVKMFSLI